MELAALDQRRAGRIAEVLARWHADEWGHLYDPAVWNLDTARLEFAEQIALGGGGPPTTYVAFDTAGQPVGSVSLVISDDLDGFEHLGPWLASLFVEPRWRSRGLGQRLIAHLLSQAPARTAGAVYLFTADHASWYAELGWQLLTTTTSGPTQHPVTVMVRSTTEAAGSAQRPRPVV